jgi:CheY-like chemotaxis protein
MIRHAGSPAARPDTRNLDNGGTILVVDDEPAIVEVLCLLLEDEGFTVIGETDPLRALHTVRRVRPCLMLTDVMMPGMSGYELASLATSIDPEMQIVFMSAVVEKAHQERPFLAKPFDLGQVVELVDDQLRAS